MDDVGDDQELGGVDGQEEELYQELDPELDAELAAAAQQPEDANAPSPLEEIRPGHTPAGAQSSERARDGGTQHVRNLLDDLGGGGGRALSTQAEDMQLLIQAVLNEKNAPEILQFRQPLLDRVEDRLSKQEEYCEALESDPTQELVRMMFSLEVRRVRYFVKLYHRTRLHKIEKLAATLMDNPDLLTRLSTHERAYCEDYRTLVARHLTDTVLRNMPDEFRGLLQVHDGGLSEGNDLIPQPLLDSHVFCKLLDDAGTVTLDEGTSVDVNADDLFMLRYRPIAHLVDSNQVVLI